MFKAQSELAETFNLLRTSFEFLIESISVCKENSDDVIGRAE